MNLTFKVCNCGKVLCRGRWITIEDPFNRIIKKLIDEHISSITLIYEHCNECE